MVVLTRVEVVLHQTGPSPVGGRVGVLGELKVKGHLQFGVPQIGGPRGGHRDATVHNVRRHLWEISKTFFKLVFNCISSDFSDPPYMIDECS